MFPWEEQLIKIIQTTAAATLDFYQLKDLLEPLDVSNLKSMCQTILIHYHFLSLAGACDPQRLAVFTKKLFVTVQCCQVAVDCKLDFDSKLGHIITDYLDGQPAQTQAA